MALVAFLPFIVALALSGCATNRYERSHELDANLPRALGMGAFAPTCLFFCLVNAEFTRGGDENITAQPGDGDVHSKAKTSIEIKQGVKP